MIIYRIEKHIMDPPVDEQTRNQFGTGTKQKKSGKSDKKLESQDMSVNTDFMSSMIDSQIHSNIKTEYDFDETFEISEDIGDEYVDTIRQILNEFTEESAVRRFTVIFTNKYGIEPQLDSDLDLKYVLDYDKVPNKDIMILAQKHFNEYGGNVF